MSPDKKAILALTADNERLRGLLNESRESVFQDIEHMRGSGVYEPDIGATIALLHNIDMALADWATEMSIDYDAIIDSYQDDIERLQAECRQHLNQAMSNGASANALRAENAARGYDRDME